LKADQLYGPLYVLVRYVLVRHEEVPYEARAVILEHQEDNALVYADVLRRKPAEIGVEGADETVAAPDERAVALEHIANRGQSQFRHEGKRGNRGIRRHGS